MMQNNPLAIPNTYLSHLMIFVDEQAYTDIEQSTFLQNEFAWFQQRTTVADDGESSWTGCYLYGENTYFEFIDPVKTLWVRRDGVAFGVDAPGECKIVEANLQSQLKTDARHYRRTRRHNDQDIPWFYSTSYNRSEDAQLGTWVMEFHEDFLKTWYPELPPHEGGMTRRDILERYSAKVARESPPTERYFKEIVDVTLALPDEDIRRFTQEVSVYGYTVRNDGQNTICEGPEVRFVLVPGTPPHIGVSKFKMTLHRNKIGQQVYRFGTESVLQFYSDQTAAWWIR